MKKDVFDTTTLLQYTDDNGRPCYLDEAGNYFYVDENGYAYYLDAEGYAYYLDENGYPYYLDENGNPYYLNEDGTVTYIEVESSVEMAGETPTEEVAEASEEALGMTQAIEAVTAEELAEASEETYEDEPEEEEAEVDEPEETPVRPTKGSDDNVFGGLMKKFSAMETMDKILMFSAVAVAFLAIFVAVALFGGKKNKGQTEDTLTLAQVGHQLDGIEVIGGKGKDAITAAINERLSSLVTEDPTPTPGSEGYIENDFLVNVDVAMELTTIKKDLKIKFSNSSSEKLVGNVPFSVVVTTPSGTSETWYDDDMDGIIYKKDIAAGNYSVVANAITDSKYSRYKIPTNTQKATVKAEITYASVNVKNEIKEESEVDTKAEDTKVDVTVESTLSDTVAWVASTSVSETYIEVASSKITDPLKLVSAGNRFRFARLAGGVDPTPGAGGEAGGGGAGGGAAVEATVTGITASMKKEYTVGDPMSVDDVEVKAQMSDGTKTSVASSECSGITINTETEGTRSFTVTYKEFSAVVSYTVNPAAVPVVTSIITDPVIKNFYVGDPDSTSDIKVTATLSNGTTEDVSSKANFDKSKVDMNKAGDYPVTVTYSAVSCIMTFRVAPVAATVSELKFDKGSILEVIKGNDYKEEDLKLTATLSDKTTNSVAYSEVKATANWDKPFDKTAVGDYKLTVTYQGKTATITVKVVEATAKLELAATSKDMYVGQTLDITPKTALKDAKYVYKNTTDSKCAIAEVKDGKIIVSAKGIGDATITIECEYTDASGAKRTTTADFKASVFIGFDKVVSKISAGAQETITVNLASGKTFSVIPNDKQVLNAELSAKDKNVNGEKFVLTGVKAGTGGFKVTTSDNKTVEFSVTVANGATLTPAKTAETVLSGEKVDITAFITNVVKDGKVTVESSDKTKATVTVADVKADASDATKGSAVVSITGVAAGSSTITLKYVQNNNELAKATITITVKTNPKTDKTTVLKDNDGNKLYVYENKKYREAVYADYYTAGIKFYKKGPAKYTGWQTINGKVYFYDANGKAVTGEQVIQGAKYTFASDGSLVVGSGTSGIDVSKWNGTIDWTAVKNSGISYVIIRVGYRGSSAGSLIVDSKFETNIKGATKAGLKVGAYFFSQAVDEVEAVEEASAVIAELKGYTISYPVFIDVESSGGRGDKIDKDTRTAVCKAFCETIKAAGYTPGIYSNKTWFESKINTSDLTKYKIWLAQYASAPSYTGRYDMWQYKNNGKVTGISGNVDLNMSYLGY